MRRRVNPGAWAATAALAVLLGTAPPGAAQGVHAVLAPGIASVAPGAVITLQLQLSEAGTPINAFDVVIEYDPAALSLEPTSPTSLQEGDAMLGACAQTFHQFTHAADSVRVRLSLMCSGVSIPGPGTLYQLNFRAAASPQLTVVRVRSARFYNGGLLVGPVTTTNDTVAIGVTLGVPPAAGDGEPFVRVAPNPALAGERISLTTSRGAILDVRIVDLMGRSVRHLGAGAVLGSGGVASWDGRDDAGAQVPVGPYLARIRTPAGLAHARVVVLR